MSKGFWASTCLLSLIIAAYLGYVIGHKDAQQAPLSEVNKFAAQPVTQDAVQRQKKRDSDQVLALVDSAPKVSQDAQIFAPVEELRTPRVLERAERLAETGEVFAKHKSRDVGREHYLQGQEFAEQYSEHDLDWQAKTNITDFLQLHEEVEPRVC